MFGKMTSLLLCGLLCLTSFANVNAATCSFVNGRISCSSDFPPSSSSQPSRPTVPSRPTFPTTPTFPTRPTFPSNPSLPPPVVPPPAASPPSGQINLQGCVVRQPPRFVQNVNDQQVFARTLFGELISSCSFLVPNFIRIAFHDAMTFQRGRSFGSNGSIRFELEVPANLVGGDIPRAVNIITEAQQVLKSIGLDLSIADLVHLAGAEAVRVSGGPSYGCVDPPPPPP
mmetsp:Transcript_720/g.2165  ORF Transcript_720/g.2165 Transcript_720/m.2165 type:complete len:228 (+) Transcript_720:143-826(+)